MTLGPAEREILTNISKALKEQNELKKLELRLQFGEDRIRAEKDKIFNKKMRYL